GNIRTEHGDIIGQHQGLMYHTIGQRQGLGIGGLKNYTESPWYVAGKDLQNNELLVVQGKNNPLLFAKYLFTRQIDWINDQPDFSKQLTAKVRYRQPDQGCMIKPVDSGDQTLFMVEFDAPQRAVTPGQYVVFYDGEVCLGGGIIEKASNSPN
ncbi:MAG: tRNA 2-thiouridine(34) synthase MnmA, partial [Pseudomonadales bacterium]|nr:tRNA 2-thiouridine(34) synthase MnmA [Pseudomonadales bacterium]